MSWISWSYSLAWGVVVVVVVVVEVVSVRRELAVGTRQLLLFPNPLDVRHAVTTGRETPRRRRIVVAVFMVISCEEAVAGAVARVRRLKLGETQQLLLLLLLLRPDPWVVLLPVIVVAEWSFKVLAAAAAQDCCLDCIME